MTTDEKQMEEIVRDLTTKSEKIRALFAAGASKADIGRFMEISYQHVYNVLARSKPSPTDADHADKDSRGACGSRPSRIALGAENALRLPESIVRSLRMTVGDDLYVRADGDTAVLMNRNAAIAWVEAVIAKGGSEADELVSELISHL